MSAVPLAVVGAGPAGRAVWSRAITHGVEALLVDPEPERPWTQTLGAWQDELPGWLPTSVVATTTPTPIVHGHRSASVDRPYCVLDTRALQEHLSTGAGQTTAASVVAIRPAAHGATLVLKGGDVLEAEVVIDATGSARRLTGGPAPAPRARQTAVGRVVMSDDLPTLFMDWRDDHGEDGWPSFLYAIPLGAGRMLLEETSLARRPKLELDVLARRLDARLAARGIDHQAVATEHVDFVVDTPVTTGSGVVVPVGATAPTIHPATGFSVAASLRLADDVASALASGGAPLDRAAAARHVVWSPGARTVHHLRRRGLEVLLNLDPDGIRTFFDLFFSLDVVHQRGYLSERDDPTAIAAAMWQVFSAAPFKLKRHLMRHGGSLIGDHRAR